MLAGSVEVVSRLVEFELSLTGRGRRSGQQLSDLILAHGFEASGSLERLLKNCWRFAPGDDHAGWQVHGIVQTFDGRGRFAPKE